MAEGIINTGRDKTMIVVHPDFDHITWPDLDGVQCSLLGPGAWEQERPSDMSDFDGCIVATAPITGIRTVDGFAAADTIYFPSVEIDKRIIGFVVHVGETILFWSSNVIGMPLISTGGSIYIEMGRGARLFPCAKPETDM